MVLCVVHCVLIFSVSSRMNVFSSGVTYMRVMRSEVLATILNLLFKAKIDKNAFPLPFI